MKKAILSALAIALSFQLFAIQDPTISKAKTLIDKELGSKAARISYKLNDPIKAHNGIIHIYGIQEYDGLPIHGTNFNVAFKDGDLLTFNHSFIIDPDSVYTGEDFIFATM